MSEHPAGWHPDPRERHEYRYWDGTAWTDHVADQGQASTDPVDRIGPREDSRPEPKPKPEPKPEPEPEPRAGEEPAATEPAASGDLWSSREGTGDPAEDHAGADAQDEADRGPTPSAGPPAASRRRSPAIAALLTVVAPGSGHVYLGAAGRTPLAAGLLAATVAAYVIAYFSFVSFLVGAVVWAAAAIFALFDLRTDLAPAGRADAAREADAAGEADAAATTATPAQIGAVLLGGGLVLVLSLLLPWYHVSFDIEGFGTSSGNGSGFEALSVLDLVLLVIGAAAALAGAAALGLGPLRRDALPAWLPLATAVAGTVAVVCVAYRLLVDPIENPIGSVGFTRSVDFSVGRAPGILLAGAASLSIAAAGLLALTQREGAATARRGDSDDLPSSS